jgi:SHS2 domain-containing protein
VPYEEIFHTADWCLHVWAQDLPTLFVEAARGMNALMQARPASGPGTRRTLHLSAPDAEALLVAFLSELVFAAEQEGLIFTDFQIELSESSEDWKLTVQMDGVPLLSATKIIKAVTYHNLHIRPTARGYEVEIVFDV